MLCSQEEDKRQNCKMRNVLYGNKCTVCNVEVKDGKKTQTVLMDGKGIYVGETSRSMYECGKEHQKYKEGKTEDIH